MGYGKLPAAHYLYLGSQELLTPCGNAVLRVVVVTNPAEITCKACLRNLGLAAAAELEEKARELGAAMRQRLASRAAGQNDSRMPVISVIGEMTGILRRVQDGLDSLVSPAG